MRNYHRKKLHKHLSRADNEHFIRLLWSTYILQTDKPDPARRYILPASIPAGAISPSIPDEYMIHRWEIETLANELMTVPKEVPRKHGPTKYLRCNDFRSSLKCVNLLRKLENSEHRIGKKHEDVSVELGRIAARQFDWQRGFMNIPQFYRNAFVYGQGPCAAQFESKHGLTLSRFSQIGFMLYVALLNLPNVTNNHFWKEAGVDWDEVEKVLELVALPFPNAVAKAKAVRRKTIRTANKPSILRQSPCLRFGKEGERIYAPLPELILERVTTGVFYDVVDGGGAVRDDYGRRFEEYCARFLSEALPEFRWETEFRYKKKPNNFDTPDILCHSDEQISVAFECKATRMSQQAMFGKNPIEERGYQDITKAVFQLWRFFSHCRRGYVERNISDDVVGVVLTLDNWLVMAETLRKKVLADAEKMAIEKDADIIEADRKPILFVAVTELERVLSVATEQTFLQAVRQADSDQYQGWRLDGVHNELFEDADQPGRDYPFANKIGNLLPWWDEMRAKAD